ncbi:hypothetical protein HPY86_01555 [candidate division WOR-3 bacterium]|nr:hypothetical protein [candidate division WOR-3 bacterium]
MKVAFPYMGDIHLVLEPILRTLGADVVIPPEPNKNTVAIGTQIAPETICLPFKITLGNMLNALKSGADTLAYVSGSWSCRFGYYGRLQADILRDLGYRFRLIELRRDRIQEIVRTVVELNNGSLSGAVIKTLKAFRLGWWKAMTLEKTYKALRETLPLVKQPEKCHRLFDEIMKEITRAQVIKELQDISASIAHRFENLPRNGRTNVLKIKLIGESYCTIEPFINFNIIKRVGEMGGILEPFLTGPRWLGFHGFRIGKNEITFVQNMAKNYWRYCVGGEDANSVGHMILACREGYDGVIHIHPFACMPSTVVQPTLIKISQEYDIPFLSISVDEHTSEAGFITRLEAFISLLERRRALSKKSLTE